MHMLAEKTKWVFARLMNFNLVKATLNGEALLLTNANGIRISDNCKHLSSDVKTRSSSIVSIELEDLFI